jgi:hypothetical protein
VRELLAELLPRWLAIALGIRRVTPAGDYWPWDRSARVPAIDTGGTFRAAWRQQDPSVDPREPSGGESSSTGSDHGWSNCTCTSGALALAYQQPRGQLAPWGGDLRHRQGDLSGGTDLYDVRAAWSTYGETLTIRSGAGWSAVVAAHDEGRAIVIQGTGNVPGSESFDGGHACAIAPETHSGGDWLFGDPLASGWQWIAPSAIRSWAERWQSSIAFAVGEAPPAGGGGGGGGGGAAPAAIPTPVPDIGAELRRAELHGGEMALDAEVAGWLDWLGPVDGRPGTAWDLSAWSTSASWGRGSILDPVAAADHARSTTASWDGAGWRALVWP